MTSGINGLVSALQSSMSSNNKDGSYDTPATIRRVEDGVAWVHIPGGVDETPVKLTMAAKAGDSVQVRISNGSAFLVGNTSAPPTDDTTANVAKNTANDAKIKAVTAKNAADIANETATQAQYTADNASNNITVLTFDLETAVSGGYTVSGDTTIEDADLDVVAKDFNDGVEGQFGNYQFRYDGTDWSLYVYSEEEWQLYTDDVSLSDYGVKLSEDVTIQSGDTIDISLSEVEGFKKAIESSYNELSENIEQVATEAEENLVSVSEELNQQIDENKSAIDSANQTLSEIAPVAQRLGFSEDYGFIIFGQGATPTEKFKLQLTSREINFVDGALGNEADINAQISDNMLNINVANITSQLLFGNYAFIKRSNNNMCLKYLG